MSDSPSSVFTVTLTEGAADTVGSLAWAINQANAYSGEDTPTIIFDASLGGQEVLMDDYLTIYRDVSIISQAETPVRWESAEWELLTINSGAQVSVGSGIELNSQVYVEDASSLSMASGTVLGARLSLYADCQLELLGTRVEAQLTLHRGSVVKGSGNVFRSSVPFCFNIYNDDPTASSTLDGILASLSASTYEAAAPRVSLGGTQGAGEVTLSALPEPLQGYELSNYATFGSDTCITLAQGVNLYLPRSSDYDITYVEGADSFIFAGNNHIYFIDSEYGYEYDVEKAVFTCNRLEFRNSTIHGTVEVSSDTTLVAEGTTFGGLVLNLTDWDGLSTPSVLANIVNCTSAEGAVLTYVLQGFGGTSVAWNEASTLALLEHAAFSTTEVESIALQSGDTLTLAAGTSWTGRSITVGDGATLVCGKDCRLAGVSYTDEWDDVVYEPPVVVEDGGTLVADHLTISGTLVVTPTSKVEGTLHFEAGSRVSLTNWSGSTQQLLDSVFANATWTSAEPVQIEIAGNHFTSSSWDNLTGDSQMVDLGSAWGGYLVPETNGYVSEATVTFAKGVDLTVEDSFSGGNLVFEGDNVVRAADGFVAHLNAYESVTAHGTRFEIPVIYVNYVSGENITFAAKVPFSVEVGAYDNTLGEYTSWDGTAATLQQVLTDALQNINGYTITEEAPILGVMCRGLSTDLTFSEEGMQGMLPEGFAGLHFTSLEYSNQTITVAAGATLDADNISLQADAVLIMEAGSKITDSVENDPDIYIGADDSSCGTLVMNGVDFNGVYIYAHGNITLRNCYGKGELEFSSTYAVGRVSVNNCDLSQMNIILLPNYSDDEPSDVVFDFSGNYWGTTDVEAIKAMITGYDDSRFIIGDILTAAPGADLTAPVLSGLTTETKKLGAGKTQVTFSWASDDAAASYTLTVDGKDYAATGTSHTLELADGAHTWSVTATDAAGNAATAAGSTLTLDATAPALSALKTETKALGEGKTQVVFSWASDDAAASYTLTVDGKDYAATGTSHTLELADGAHTWSITATDAAGNAASTNGSGFTLESTTPDVPDTPDTPDTPDKPDASLTLNKPELGKGSKGKMKVTFSWSGEESMTYVLTVDGKDYKLKKKTEKELTLKDGTHSYTVTATDAAGKTITQSGSVLTDGTAPTVSLTEPSLGAKGTGSQAVTLSWNSSEAATYTVTVDKKEVYSGKEAACTVNLADGKHSYSVTATDSFGNVSKAKSGKLTVDTTAPALSLKEEKLKKVGDGLVKATLSWKGEKGATYTVVVDGTEVVSGSKKTSLILAKLADGEHSYSVTATDAAGNSITQSGSFTADTSAPELRVTGLALSKADERKMNITLSWESEAGASYTLKVDGKKQVLSGTSHTLSGIKDGKHKYELTATDAAGNKVTLRDSFVFDATAPKVSTKKLKLSKAGEGQVSATFRWKGEKGATYSLVVDGETLYTGTETSCTLTLRDGTHSYSVSATDAAGNVGVSKSATLSYDATAPVVSGASLSYVETKKGKVQAALSWAGEEGATYTVYLNGKKVYRGKKTSCTLKVAEGTESHSYSIVATDKARNTSEALTGSFDVASLLGGTATGLDRELSVSAGDICQSDSTLAGAALSGLETGSDKTEYRLLA